MSSSTLALGRALTKRIRRADGASTPSLPGRTQSSARGFDRGQISGPVELISTTNVLAYTAPDIRSVSNSSSSSSLSSGDDWDLSRAFISTPATSPEPSDSEPSPTTESPEPNQLSPYFKLPSRSATSASPRKSTSLSEDAPVLPSRSLTHTKRAHIARHRSLSRSRSSAELPPLSLAAPQVITKRSSVEMFSDTPHPFGRELEQVNEVAEDFGVRDSLLDEEEQILRQRGLKKFAAGDYMQEIEDLYGSIFEDKMAPTAWI